MLLNIIITSILKHYQFINKFMYLLSQGDALKLNILNISLIFNDIKKYFKWKCNGFEEDIFGHVIFFLSGGFKKIRWPPLFYGM